ncbi:MAG: pentapeptide repeat-containing protein, partial [Desulfobacterales bacterium]
RAVFTGKLDFWDTCFEQEAACGATTFNEKVSFEECLFRTGVNFAKAVFEKEVAFTACDFEADVRFDNTTFAAGADFSASTFRAEMSCRNAQFKKRVNLTNTTFEKTPDMTGSNLDEKQEAEQVDEGPERPYRKRPIKRAEFNPWRELDKVSKKTMSRRHLLRSLFRFLPEDKEK